MIGQVRRYAFAVAADERFPKRPDELDLLGAVEQNERTGTARIPNGKSTSGRRLQSKADARRNYNMTIWAKSWSEIIEECTARLKFFQDRLNYNAKPKLR